MVRTSDRSFVTANRKKTAINSNKQTGYKTQRLNRAGGKTGDGWILPPDDLG